MHNINKQNLLAPLLGILFVLSTILSTSSISVAATTTPVSINYQGRLLDSSSTPLTGAHTFRFSLWSTADWVSGDTLGSGAINTGSAGYTGWQEIQPVTVGAFGLFDISLGSITTFPSFDANTHKFLQVEVKTTGALDTSYEILDPTSVLTDVTDRKTVHNQAYAQNADTIDNADVGTAAGDLAVLGAGGIWDIARIPAGTNNDIWQIDVNDNATGGVVQLSFGPALSGHILKWDPDGVAVGDGWFDFSDDVNIQGNLTSTGTINGVNLAAIPFTNLAVRSKTVRLKPHFPGAVAEAVGGGSHRGKIESHFIDTDGGAGPANFSYYQWTTKQGVINDYDIVLRFKIPDDFVSWDVTPIVFRYKTGTALVADNKIDITIEDSLGFVIGALTGGSNLANATYTTSNIGFGGGGIFIAGSEITIKIKMTTKNTGSVQVSDLLFNYIGR